MSDVAKCLGDEEQIEHNGRLLTLVPWDRYGIQKKYRAWMIQQATSALREMRASLTPDEYGEALERLNRAISAGTYDWGGDVWAKHLSSEAGLVQIVYLDLKVNHPDVTPELATELMRDHTEEMEKILTRLVSDPNSRTPGTQTKS